MKSVDAAIASIIMLLVSCSGLAAEYRLLSLVALLSEPSKHDGKDVIVSGYLCSDGAGRYGLFLTKIDCKEMNYGNAIKLETANLDKKLPKKPSLLSVAGKFHDWSGFVHTDEPFQWGFIEVVNLHGRNLP